MTARHLAGAQAVDIGFMTRALRLAERGRYTTDPNPRVGCLIVRNGEIVGEGWHYKAGEPHAERNALDAAGERAEGATAYVTLEPCCHHGRTPPCSQGLIDAGVSRLVCAMVDPNPLVSGRGIAQLRDAGIVTEVGLMEAQARALNPGFIKRMEQGRPFVRCKMAASLDGRTAMASGESKWISSEASRRDVQRLRAGSSAIVTGIGTVLADDPSLNVRISAARLPGLSHADDVRQPLRVVVDSFWRMPTSARMLALPGSTLIVGIEHLPERRAALQAAGAEVMVCRQHLGRVDLAALAEALAERGVNEVLLEAGPTLAGAAMSAGILDEIVLYIAPHLMGESAQGLFDLPGIERMSDRVALDFMDMRRLGPDLRVTARPRLH